MTDPSSETLSEILSDIVSSGYRSEKPLVLWAAHSVILSLYRERSTGRFRLTFTVSTNEMSLEYHRVIRRLPYSAGDRGCCSFSFEDGAVSCFEGLRDEGHLLTDEYDLRSDSSLEHTGTLNFMPGKEALDLALMPVGRDLNVQHDAVFRPLFNDFAKAFSPAPPNTIAGAILRNLAYAPEGQRLDKLLLANACDKVRALRQLLSAEEERYKLGIRRLTVDRRPNADLPALWT